MAGAQFAGDVATRRFDDHSSSRRFRSAEPHAIWSWTGRVAEIYSRGTYATTKVLWHLGFLSRFTRGRLQRIKDASSMFFGISSIRFMI